jgi:hypothetical protein
MVLGYQESMDLIPIVSNLIAVETKVENQGTVRFERKKNSRGRNNRGRRSFF